MILSFVCPSCNTRTVVNSPRPPAFVSKLDRQAVYRCEGCREPYRIRTRIEVSPARAFQRADALELHDTPAEESRFCEEGPTPMDLELADRTF